MVNVPIDEEKYWAAISTVIRMEMTALGLSQAKLAEQVGISRDALGNYLSGKREMPFKVFMRIATALDTSIGSIISTADNRLK